MSWVGLDQRIIANRYQQMFINGYLDVNGRTIVQGDLSLNSRLVVAGDASFIGFVQMAKDVSLNNKLYVNYDTSLNGNVQVGGNLTVNGNLTAVKIANKYIVNTTTNNYQLIVSEDLSLNGRLFTGGNVSSNGNLVLNSNFTGTVSPNTTDANTSSWGNNGISWTSSASSIYGDGLLPPFRAFDTTANTWASSNATGQLYASDGTYPGTGTATTTNITYEGSITGITGTSPNGTLKGEWLQISSNNIPLILSSYILLSTDVVEFPRTYFILGSNDGTNWTAIHKGVIPSTPRPSTISSTEIMQQGTTYSNYGNNNATLTVYSSSAVTNTYTYFRIVATETFSNAANSYIFQLREWNIKFTPPTTNKYASLSMQPTNYNQLNVMVGTTNALSVNSSGYVGIGSTNPSVALDVNGSILGRNIRLSSLGSTVGTAGIFNGGSKNNCGYLPFFSWNGTRMGYIGFCPTSNTTGLGTGTMTIQADNGCTGWNFNTGNVGIGTTNPTVALDVVGGAKLQNSFTETTISPNSTNANDWTWRTNYLRSVLQWTASSSSNYSTTNWGYLAFNNTTTDAWACQNQVYTAGSYSGGITFSAITNTGTTITVSGEWLQIQSPNPVSLPSYTLTGSTSTQFPKEYSIIGSNNGSTWYVIHDVSFSGTTVPVAPGVVTNIINVNQTYSSSTFGSSTITTRIYGSNTTASYTYFKLIISKTFNSSGTQFCSLMEWTPTFKTTITNSIMSLDATNLNQLNINGGASFTGTVSVNSGILALNIPNYNQRGTTTAYPSTRFITIAPGTGSDSLFNGYGTDYVAGQGLSLKGQGLNWTNNTSYPSEIQIDGGRSKLGGLDNGEIRMYTGNTQRMTIADGGYVGIGITNPSSVLQLACNTSTSQATAPDGGSHHGLVFTSPKTGSTLYSMAMGVDYSSGYGYINCAGNHAIQPLLLQSRGGYVGIGTTDPKCTLHVQGTASSTSSGGTYYGTAGTGTLNNSPTAVSIYTEGWILTKAAFGAATTINFSDRRMKNNIQDIEDQDALNILRKIQPKLFNYNDTIRYGATPVYGFIAQEIENILPYAVNKMEMSIPSIYELADISGCIVSLKTKSTAIFNADINGLDASGNAIKIQFYDETNVEVNRILVKIIDETTFIVDKPFLGDKIFVYGHEINDFMGLQKDAIFTVTTAALQQIDREYNITKQEVIELKTENQELKSEIQTILSRLSALENK